MHCALIHGFAGDPAAWGEVIDAWLLPDAPLAVALPGHGAGPVLDTWEQNLDEIAHAIHGCEVVVGYSLGARVALGLVASGRIGHGVFIGVNPGIGDNERQQRRVGNPDRAFPGHPRVVLGEHHEQRSDRHAEERGLLQPLARVP